MILTLPDPTIPDLCLVLQTKPAQDKVALARNHSSSSAQQAMNEAMGLWFKKNGLGTFAPLPLKKVER